MRFLAAILIASAALARAAAPDIVSASANAPSDGAVEITVVTDTGNKATKLTLNYGFGGNLDQLLIQDIPASSSPVSRPFNVALIGGQTYDFKITAENADGSDVYQQPGDDIVVPPYRPTVIRVDPTTSSSGDATLKATVVPNGADVTAITFEYGSTTSYGSSVNGVPFAIVGGTTSETTVTANITGLVRGTPYHYRINATNSIGTTSTLDATVTIAANKAPIAADDSATVHGNESVLINVLANDKDPDGDGLKIAAVTQGTQGKVEIVGSQIRYTPIPASKGSDTFTYTVKDDYTDAPASDTATVTIRAPSFAAQGLHAAEIKDEDGNVIGMIRTYGTSSGSVTGKVMLYTQTYSFSGRINENGQLYYTIPRDDSEPIQLNMVFGEDAESAFEAALASDGNEWSASSAATTLTPARRDELVGRYNVQFPAPSSTEGPQGTGFARLDVKPWGEVSFRGKLGDGTKYSGSGVLTGSDESAGVAMWVTPRQNRVSANFTFGDGTNPDVSGELNWQRKSESDANFYPDGFFASLNPSGSRYLEPERGQRALEVNGADAEEATISLSGGNLSANITHKVRIDKDDGVRILDPNGDGLTLKIDRGNGTFRGQFDHPFDNSRRKFEGVLVQNQNNGRGVFLGINQSGGVALTLGTQVTPTPPTQPTNPTNPTIPNIPNIPGNGVEIPGGIDIPDISTLRKRR